MRIKFTIIGFVATLIAGCTANARLDLSEYQGQAKPSSIDATTHPQGSGEPQTFQDQHRNSSEVMKWEAVRRTTDQSSTHEVHVVREGDTLYSIAQNNGVTLAMLYSVNGLLNDQLTPGQHIKIPTEKPATP